MPRHLHETDFVAYSARRWECGGYGSHIRHDKPRSHSGDRCLKTLDEPYGIWEKSIASTSQAISKRWGSDGGVDQWELDDDKQLPFNERRRKGDEESMVNWSKLLPADKKLEQLVF